MAAIGLPGVYRFPERLANQPKDQEPELWQRIYDLFSRCVNFVIDFVRTYILSPSSSNRVYSVGAVNINANEHSAWCVSEFLNRLWPIVLRNETFTPNIGRQIIEDSLRIGVMNGQRHDISQLESEYPLIELISDTTGETVNNEYYLEPLYSLDQMILKIENLEDRIAAMVFQNDISAPQLILADLRKEGIARYYHFNVSDAKLHLFNDIQSLENHLLKSLPIAVTIQYCLLTVNQEINQF